MPPIKTKKQATVPAGTHTGRIIRAEEVQKDFGEGPEPIIEVEIKPEYEAADGSEVLTVSVIFPPILNGLSALSGFLTRLNLHPEDGAEWDPAEIVGTRVRFDAFKADNGFTRVKKDSIVAAE